MDMESLNINGTDYPVSAMRQGLFPEGETWEKDISAFLREWFNCSDHVIGHTSGSTGEPKEIRLLKSDMLASAKLTNVFLGLSSASRLLLCLSPSYIAGKMMIVRALLANASLLAVKPCSQPFEGLHQVVDLAAVVPMQLEETLKSSTAAEQLKCVKSILIGGAPVSPALLADIRHLPSVCYATYGMTETVSHVALKKLNGKDKSRFYSALGEVSFEKDERGCLVIHAPHLQQQQFVTNDLADLIDPFHFEWTGRYDHVINTGGIKISPENLEQKLSVLIPEPFFITSLPDSRLGQKIVLVIEHTPYTSEQRKLLDDRLKKILTRFELPREIYFRAPFERTYSGKIIRKI